MLAHYFYLKCSGVETESSIKWTYSSKVYVSPLVNALDHVSTSVCMCKDACLLCHSYKGECVMNCDAAHYSNEKRVRGNERGSRDITDNWRQCCLT